MESFDASFYLDFVHGFIVENMGKEDREKFDATLARAAAGSTEASAQPFLEDELAKRRARIAANQAAMARNKR